MKITKIYNKLSLIRDKGILTPFIDWIRDLLWDKYYKENNPQGKQ